MKKKALITGISGMVGSHLADFLVKNTDWEIHGLIRWRSPLNNISSIIDKINNQNRIFLHYGDLKDSISIDKLILDSMPDYVFHLAAQSFPKTSFIAPIDTLDTNIQGTVRLLDALKKYKSDALIHVCSSSEIFGRVSKDKLPIDENCSFHPASPYAISKVGTDLVGRFYYEAYNMNISITRMFTHTGPRRGDVFAESTFAKQIAMAEFGFTKPIINVGNLESLRTVADVRDAVRAYYLLLTKNPIPGECYNIGGTKIVKIGEILNDLIKLSKIKKYKIIISPDRIRPIDADLQVPNTSKFSKHTGWKPLIKYEDTIKDLLNYWRDRVEKEGNIFLTR